MAIAALSLFVVSSILMQGCGRGSLSIEPEVEGAKSESRTSLKLSLARRHLRDSPDVTRVLVPAAGPDERPRDGVLTLQTHSSRPSLTERCLECSPRPSVPAAPLRMGNFSAAQASLTGNTGT